MFAGGKKRQHVSEGERARMGKMRSHGPWEIPPLFAITVTFQNSSLLVPAEDQSGTILTTLNLLLVPKEHRLSWLNMRHPSRLSEEPYWQV